MHRGKFLKSDNLFSFGPILMKPTRIHVTQSGATALSRQRGSRNSAVYSGLARHPRINKQGRMHGDPKPMTLHRFVKVF